MSGEEHWREKFLLHDASLPLVSGWFSAVRCAACGALLPGTCHLLAGSLSKLFTVSFFQFPPI